MSALETKETAFSCPNCGNQEHTFHYYDTLSTDRECTNCGHVY